MRAGIWLLAAIAGSLAIGSLTSLDVYHASLFYLLLTALAVNTTLCSLGRLRKNPPRITAGPPLLCREIVPGALPAEGCRALKTLLEGEGYKTAASTDGDKLILHGEGSLLRRWGSFSAHFSVVLVAAGVLYGAQAGFETTITLTEGSSQSVSWLANKALLLRLNALSTTYYADGTVSDWLCDLSAEREGKAAVRQEVRINHPLTFDHTKIYLASQGILIYAQVQDRGGQILCNLETAVGEPVTLPQTAGKVLRVLRFIPDYDPLRPMVSKSQQPRNPYIIYAVSGDHEEGKWLAAPVNEAQPLGNAASLIFSFVPAAGMHVKYDPGVSLVWSGFALLLAGLFVIYYLPYRTVRIEIYSGKDGLEIICSGSGADLESLRDKLHRCLNSGDGRGRL